MTRADECLLAVGLLSPHLAVAERDDDAEKLAGIVAACRLVEGRAANLLANRATEQEIEDAISEARTALGW